MRLRHLLLLVLAIGCGGSDPVDTGEDEDDGPKGACGETTVHPVSLVGKVTAGGAPVEGAEVVLEDRGYTDSDLADAITAADGTFSMDVDEITSVEDCWGTLLDYVLVATDGVRTGEKGVNSHLHQAIIDEETADITAFPVEIE